MKIVSGALAAVVLAGLGWSIPAQAQGLPQGSYLQSCSGARMEGDTLVARCRTRDGREERSALAGVNRCVGDIGNSNGSLQCNMGGRAQAVLRQSLSQQLLCAQFCDALEQSTGLGSGTSEELITAKARRREEEKEMRR